MIHDVVSVEVLTGYCLKLGFDDGVVGIVDISQQVRFQGVFAPLADQAFFEQVTVNADIGSIAWPNGADLDPLVLYTVVTKTQLNLDRWQGFLPQQVDPVEFQRQLRHEWD
ncbi:MAG: DUF2442 domain-containing protein [Oscillatoriales cyanobacterium]|nr:MAG: DUF2442 domain-containing protein [Oscillatoriales cyanobacterium]